MNQSLSPVPFEQLDAVLKQRLAGEEKALDRKMLNLRPMLLLSAALLAYTISANAVQDAPRYGSALLLGVAIVRGVIASLDAEHWFLHVGNGDYQRALKRFEFAQRGLRVFYVCLVAGSGALLFGLPGWKWPAVAGAVLFAILGLWWTRRP